MVRSSAGFAAARTASRSRAPSPTATCRWPSGLERRSRWMSSGGACRLRYIRTRCSSASKWLARMRNTRRVDDAVGRISLWRGRDVRVTSLSGGLTNENYLVEAGGDRYVMRIPGASTELLSIDRVNEVHNARAAASTGIGPAVLEHIPQLDVMVLEFIPGPTMSAPALQTESMVRRMAASVTRLHGGAPLV